MLPVRDLKRHFSRDLFHHSMYYDGQLFDDLCYLMPQNVCNLLHYLQVTVAFFFTLNHNDKLSEWVFLLGKKFKIRSTISIRSAGKTGKNLMLKAKAK